jgi:GT2 family glycosyltransferase
VDLLKIKKLAVLITCHNRREKTLSCLRALYSNVLSKYIQMDIFLVDDGSTDGTSEAVRTEFTKVHVLSGSGDLYWNRGMYLAWKTAAKSDDYDYYLWLNDDTILTNNAIIVMLDFSQSIENSQIIVGATSSENEEVVTYSGFTDKEEILTPNGSWQSCKYFNGNIVLIPSLVFEKVGFLDHRFRHALGDIDYGLRAAKLGFIHMLSPIYLGYCEGHLSESIWCNKSYPLIKRLKNLYTPLGNDAFEFFIFDRRHNGLFKAMFHFFTIHLRTFFPALWYRKTN